MGGTSGAAKSFERDPSPKTPTNTDNHRLLPTKTDIRIAFRLGKRRRRRVRTTRRNRRTRACVKFGTEICSHYVHIPEAPSVPRDGTGHRTLKGK